MSKLIAHVGFEIGKFLIEFLTYSKICLKLPLSKRPKLGFQDQISLNTGQKYCRMLQAEHSAILSTFIKLQFVIRIFVLSIFEWLLKTGFSVNGNKLFSRVIQEMSLSVSLWLQRVKNINIHHVK